MNYFAVCLPLKFKCCHVLLGETVMVQDPAIMDEDTQNDERGFMLRSF